MKINELMKATLKDHRNKIELTQWAIISGVASLVYSEFLRRIKNRNIPVKVVMVPEIKTITEFLDSDNDFMTRLSSELIDRMNSHPLFQKYNHAPELVLFNDDNVEILKTILDLYMIPTIGRHISETVSAKFGIGKPDQQLVREDPTIDLFEREQVPDEYFQFVVDQIVVQLLLLIPTMDKQIELPGDNNFIMLGRDEVITINNDNAICPIHFYADIIRNEKAMKLIGFVTSTNIKIDDHVGCDAAACKPNGQTVDYYVTTNPFNHTIVTWFNNIVEVSEDS